MPLKIFVHLSFIFLLFFLAGELFAERQVRVSGNNRTDSVYIEALIDRCMGNIDPLSDEKKVILETCLMNSKLFSKVRILFSAEEINVVVDERWTLIPIPMVQGGSGKETSYGIIVMETNFLGRGKHLYAGGVTGKGQASYILSYRDPSIFFSRFRGAFSIHRMQNEQYQYDGEEEINGLNESTELFSFEFGRSFTEELNSSIRFLLKKNRYEVFNGYQTPEDSRYNLFGWNIRYKNTDYKFYYQEGFQLRLDVNQEYSPEKDRDPVTHVISRMQLQLPAFDHQILQIRARGSKIENAGISYVDRIGGQAGLRGIPSGGVWTDAYAAFGVDYQFPLLELGAGYWTLAPFYDQGSLQVYDTHKVVNYHAYGLGTYFFLRKIAIPGLGIIIGRNNRYQDTFYSFTIGFSR